MSSASAILARSITWAGSKQSYLTARLLMDRDLVNDCYRAYAYFRWADDVVDEVAQSEAERIAFITRQKGLIDRLYRNERPDDLTPEETMIADLIGHDRGAQSGLHSFIRNFLAIIEFDAHRKGGSISRRELTWYSDTLGKAVTDCIQYFIGHGHPYPTDDRRYLAATAAHITHMLRDLVVDIPDGFINIPREYLDAHGISIADGRLDVAHPAIRAWVQERVKRARQYLAEGKEYLDELDVLRCKIAGYWYCARFEVILDAIAREEYVLRAEYDERHSSMTWLKMAWLSIAIAHRHFVQRGWRNLWRSSSSEDLGGKQLPP